MEYETYRRFPHHSPFGYPLDYPADRHAPLGIGMTRQDARAYPLGAPHAGPRGRGGGAHDDEGNVIPRRRIAVACARCRKRKIRCSGDPGNGSGCLNCRSAGVDQNTCQFHRVGSTEALPAYEHFAHSASLQAPYSTALNFHDMIPSLTSATFHSRSLDNVPYPQLDTRPIYPHTWTVPYPEETSPVETFNQDVSALYMPAQQNITNVYNQGNRSHQENQKVSQNRQTVEQDNSSLYATNGLSLITPPTISVTTSAEPLSPLNMTSIQSALPLTLPERPHPRQLNNSDTSITERQLPIPLPTTSQNTRNIVDQMQDQRLRSSNIAGVAKSTRASPYKQAASWPSIGCEITKLQTPAAPEPRNEDVAVSSSMGASVDGVNVAPNGFIATKAASGVEDSSTSISQPPLNFSTAPLLEPLPVSLPTVTYSNFRNCPVPTTSATEAGPSTVRQFSQASLYNYDVPSKRHSTGSSTNEGTLVSGHRYTPLNASPSYHNPEYSVRATPIHRASMSKIDQAF